jgi:hypothetical protein
MVSYSFFSEEIHTRNERIWEFNGNWKGEKGGKERQGNGIAVDASLYCACVPYLYILDEYINVLQGVSISPAYDSVWLPAYYNNV